MGKIVLHGLKTSKEFRKCRVRIFFIRGWVLFKIGTIIDTFFKNLMCRSCKKDDNVRVRLIEELYQELVYNTQVNGTFHALCSAGSFVIITIHLRAAKDTKSRVNNLLSDQFLVN